MTREDIISKMCREYRPFYDVVVYDENPDGKGTTPEQQAEIYHKMMFLYDNVIEKHMRLK